jgi:hypothetical protein
MVIGRKFLGSVFAPLFLLKGTILPASQVFGILPELKIILNRSTYNAKNISRNIRKY